MKSVAALTLVLLSLAPARAEHRVALVIADDPGAAARRLADHGFRCETSGPLSEKELRRKIESWAAHTPTNSTALVWFAGEVRSENHDGKPAVSLVASNDRLVPVTSVLELLDSKGGSRMNLLVGVWPNAPAFTEELPAGCAVSLGANDVYGNVAEWCRDLGARGGGWVSVPENCRSAYRDYYSSRNDQDYLGYRLVIQTNAPEPAKRRQLTRPEPAPDCLGSRSPSRCCPSRGISAP